MAGIQLPGVGSGFPVQQFVDVTVQAERAPKENTFNRKQKSLDVQISSYGSVKKELDGFKKSLKDLTAKDAFQKRSVKLSNEGFLSAKADKNAVAGSYDIVVKQLAKAHKLGTAHVSGDGKENLGGGQISLAVGDKSFSVNIDAEKSSLHDIAQAINRSDDNEGVKATVVKDDLGTRLVLFSEKTGLENSISVSATGSGLSSFFTGSQTIQEAQDAQITIDGATVTRSSNEIKDAIAGVTFNIDKVSNEDEPSTKLTIGFDKESVTKNLKSFVDSYNKIIETTKKLTKYDAEKNVAGPLNGDSLTRSITTQLRDIMGEQVEGAGSGLQSLADLGITTKQDGTLEIDNKVLDAHIADNFDKIGRLFDGDSGLVSKLDTLIDEVAGRSGLLTTKNESLTEQQSKLDKQKIDFEERMGRFEQRVMKQFNAMDAMIAKMNDQLGTMMSMLGGNNGMF